MDNTPESCTLCAVDDGGCYVLEVLDSKGRVIAYLDWPKSWPEIVSPSYLTVAGFKIVPA